MNKSKKWLILISIALGILIALIFIFRDNTDTEKISKEQEESSKEAANDALDVLNNEQFDVADSL
jgi:uncharacterized protein YpmB